MPAKGQIVKPAVDRFMDKVFIDPHTGCWLWQGAKERRFGYGKFRHNGVSKNAHRASWELFHGPIPPGLFVCHTCDVPGCVNPDHLFLGTSDDNNKDRASKNRTVTRQGEANNKAKLSECDVIQIRQLWLDGFSGTDIAKLYPVNHCAIYDILNNKTWRHVK